MTGEEEPSDWIRVLDRALRWAYRWAPGWVVKVAFYGVFALILVIPGAIGWFIGAFFFEDGPTGAVVTYIYGACLLFVWERIPWAIGAIIIYVPLLWSLVLAVRLLLLPVAAENYSGAADFLLPPRDVLLVALIGGVLTLKTLGGDRFTDFLAAVTIRFSFISLLALLAITPEETDGRVLVGAVWGVVAALCAVFSTTSVDERPVNEAWVPLLLIGIFMIGTLLVGTFGNLGDTAADDRTLQEITVAVIPVAMVTATATYLIACLIAWRGP